MRNSIPFSSQPKFKDSSLHSHIYAFHFHPPMALFKQIILVGVFGEGLFLVWCFWIFIFILPNFTSLSLTQYTLKKGSSFSLSHTNFNFFGSKTKYSLGEEATISWCREVVFSPTSNKRKCCSLKC